ncbi:7539_t:CDS:2 [Diversispora eburnea]|uniref:7539_t:CDS:1 n=1 Tax=Diversispora eburnea TaxID=1213867 RepID=A0A9N8YNC5_9GLOM|nr:7539_t:CDS:2 [Diversispora eburnea]
MQQKINSGTESEDSQENENSSLPSFKPPLGFERGKHAKVASKFNVSEVENNETEIWIIKVPSRIVKADLSGKSFKIPVEATEGSTKVANLQKKLHETIFTSYQKRTVETMADYGVYIENLGNLQSNNESKQSKNSSHQVILDKMQEFELLIPNNSSNSSNSNGELVLSSKKPTRYFNIYREIEFPDSIINIKKSRNSLIPQHPPESFIPRFITTFPEFPKERTEEVNLEKENFRKKLINEWEFNRWHKEIKKHNKKMREAYYDWQEKYDNNNEDSENNENKDDLDSEEFLTTTDEETDLVKKKKTKINHESRSFTLKLQNRNEIDSEEEKILAEVMEEEEALAKIAHEQIRIKEEKIQNLEEAEKKTAETWTSSLVTYPKFERPITWWSKMREKILVEEEKKLKPYIIKRDWSMQERLEYYKEYHSEAPSYPISEAKGQEIEINYDGIYDKITVPKPHPKRIKSPPKQGTLGYISPCVEYIDE